MNSFIKMLLYYLSNETIFALKKVKLTEFRLLQYHQQISSRWTMPNQSKTPINLPFWYCSLVFVKIIYAAE